MKIFITGGAKNGKSHFAQDACVKLSGGGAHYYVATMMPSDKEDENRIINHLKDREGMGFVTIEQGLDIHKCLNNADTSGAFLVDSITALLMNEIFFGAFKDDCKNAALKCKNDLKKLISGADNFVFVSDYIYSDAALYDDFTNDYRKGLAMLDRFLAEKCDVVIEMNSGILKFHKGDFKL